MPIIVIHGSALVAISQKISSYRKQFDPIAIVELNGKDLGQESIITEVTTPNLFSPTKLVLIENGENLDITQFPDDQTTTIIFRFFKQLSAASVFLKNASKKKVQIVEISEKEETTIFPFLDALAEKNAQALGKFDGLYEKFGSQYLLTMIFYMLRRMIQTPKKLPSFIMQKLEKQKRNFPQQKLVVLYKAALETDFKIKTGQAEEKIALTLLVNEILTI